MTALVRFMGGLTCAGALVLASCGGQAGAPQFVQAFGTYESPCAVGALPSTVVQHCVADVLIENQGGEGYGHLTVLVPLASSKGGSASVPPIKCGASIPDTPNGGYTDVACVFDLAAGMTLTNYPTVQSIDFVGASSSAPSGPDTNAIAALILTAGTALLALAALIVVISVGRRPAARQGEPTDSPSTAAASTPKTPGMRPAKPGGVDAEYDLPQLPS